MIKKYGLLIGLFLSASVFTWPKPAGGASAAVQPTAWQQVGSALIWPFRPFEIVDRDDEVRKKYKAEIVSGWNNPAGGWERAICGEKDPADWHSLDVDTKKKKNYLRYKLENLCGSSVLPTRNQILIWKYGPKCKLGIPIRWILRFAHGWPYSYAASGLYYCALATGSVEGYKKAKKWLRKNSTSPKASKNRKDKKLKCATLHHDCAWCMARQQTKNQTDITEGSL